MIDPAVSMGCVTLRVADMARQTAFYRDVVGLTVREQSADRTELGTATRPLVALRALPGGRRAARAAGLYHLALRVPDRAALGAWLTHYLAAGAPNWQGAADHAVSDALYLADAEGNGIEITADTDRATWERLPSGELNIITARLDLERLLADADPAPWAGIAEGTDMGHVHLRVANLARARAFYVDALGFELQLAFRGSALFIAAGGYHHHLGMNTWESAGAPPLPADAYGLDTYEIVWPDAAGRDAAAERLAAAGYAVTRDGEVVARDPDGNRVVLAAA